MEDSLHPEKLLGLIKQVQQLHADCGNLSEWPYRSNVNAEHCYRMAATMRRIADDFAVFGSKDDLNSSFSFLKKRWDSGYHVRREELLVALARAIQLMKEPLRLLDLTAYLSVADKGEVGTLLRDAREEHKHTRDTAADECGVSGDSIKGWESGKSRPRDQHLTKLAHYIESGVKK